MNFLKNNLQNKILTIVGGLLLISVLFFSFNYYNSKTNTNRAEEINKALDAIKQIESEQPPRIGKTPSDTEIYNSKYIKHIRLALNGYLDDSNNGIEEEAILTESVDGMECGLNNFDKAYFKSKFVILNASDANYGGVQANIVFIDKPDAIFWVWIYNLGEFETRETHPNFVLRTFCKVGPDDKLKASFPDIIKTRLKNGDFPYIF